MRFRFDAEASDGLRVLPEIPDLTPCLIEGRNGIGKTVAVRLLELIAGGQPFDGYDRQWHSLRQRLGRTVVTIDSLRDGETVTFMFTPDSWDPDAKPPLDFGDWLGEATIDGNPVSVADVQALLWVERFAGNEDLDDTLRRRTRIYADHAERSSQRVDRAVSEIATLIEPLREQLLAVDPAELRETSAQLQASEKEELRINAELTGLAEEHERVLEAIQARDRLRSAEDPASGLHQRLGELKARLKERNGERTELEEKIGKTRAALERQGDPQAALGDAQRTLRYRQKRLRNVEADIERLASQLDVPALVDDVETARTAAQESLDLLSERRREIDAGGMVGRLIDDVSGFLRAPNAQDLDDQVLMVIEDAELSVQQARDGMAVRREQLRQRPAPDELQSVMHDTAQLRRRLARLGSLMEEINKADQIIQRIAEGSLEEKKAEEAVAKAGHRDEQYRADNQRLGAVEEEIDSINEQITDVHVQLGLEGGQSLEDARADLVGRLHDLGLESDDQLDDRESAQREQVNQARLRARRTSEHLTALRRSVTLLTASIDAAVAAVRSDERFDWLTEMIKDGGEPAAEVFARLRGAVVGLIDELEDARNLVQIVGQFAATALEDPPTMIPDVELYAAVQSVLGNELRRSLDTSAIRERLFGGAHVDSINLASRELVLSRDGVRSQPRPFDTFSTGEQAFAFTQARILELEPSDRPNRLLVLDEFGAFVAADRMPDLAEFLQSEAVAPIADQVLVILPLQTDYEAEIEDTTGALRAKYEERVNQLKARDYYTQLLEA